MGRLGGEGMQIGGRGSALRRKCHVQNGLDVEEQGLRGVEKRGSAAWVNSADTGLLGGPLEPALFGRKGSSASAAASAQARSTPDHMPKAT